MLQINYSLLYHLSNSPVKSPSLLMKIAISCYKASKGVSGVKWGWIMLWERKSPGIWRSMVHPGRVLSFIIYSAQFPLG